ncbi:MAG TPA: hypothetical protein VEQ10_08855 [Vicinamibacteria bacterium]|nr:hypothetical protein [Vicinamibacteria bacterium]
MKRHFPATAVLAAAFASAAVSARADDPTLDPARSEVSVYGGISILDARSSAQSTITVPPIPAVPGYRNQPGFPGYPGGTVQLGTETALGNGGLVGLRYAFYLRKQLALEADASVVPGQDLHTSVGPCSSPGCYPPVPVPNFGQPFEQAINAYLAGLGGATGRGTTGSYGNYGRYGVPYGYGGHDVTAWHYGAGLTYDILGRDVRPFLLLGAGGVSYDGEAGAKTDFVLRFGAGVKLYFGRLGVRVDATDYLVFNNFLTGHDEHDVHVTGGGFVRF